MTRARARAAKEAFEAAERHLEDNPDDLAGAIERFVKAGELGRATAYELRSDARAEKLRGILKTRAREALEDAEGRAAAVAAEGDFDSALAALDSVPDALASVVEDERRAAAKRIADRASEKIDSVIGEAAKLVAAGDAGAARAALEALDGISYAAGMAKAEPRVQALKDWMATAREKAEEDALAGARAAFDRVFAEFDAFLAKGEYAAARGKAGAAAGRKEFAPAAEELEAASRVAGELEKRAEAIRRGAEGLRGGTVSLDTVKGRSKGEVDAVTDEGIRLASKISDRGRVVGETKVTVKWESLTRAQVDTFAGMGGWDAAGADARVALAYMAFWRDDLAEVDKRLAPVMAGGEHPTAKHLASTIAAIRTKLAEAAAAEAWEAIGALAALDDLTQAQAKKLLADIDGFVRDHGATALAKSKAAGLTALRTRAELAQMVAGLGKGLAGWWKFDDGAGEFARDSSQYGNHAKVRGAEWVRGRTGTALRFDGVDAHVEMGNPASLQVTGDMTISMWLNPAALGKRQNPYNKSYGAEGTLTLETDGSINYWYGTSGSDTQPYMGFRMPRPLEVGVWSHVVVVRDLAAMKLYWYKDGAEATTGGAQYAAAAVSRQELLIGQGYVGNFEGMIDDVRVYNRALAAGEVTLLHQSTAGRRPAAPRGPGRPPGRGKGKGEGRRGGEGGD